MATADRRNLLVLGIPIDSEALTDGCNLAPAALREAGLVRALGATDCGDVAARITDPRRDQITGLIGFAELCAASEAIRRRMNDLLAQPGLPVVVGGCCSILPGIHAALRETYGRVGLAFIDGHLDFYTGTTTPTGSAADIDLGVVTGFGPAGLIDLGGPPPLVQPRDAWVLGYRDAAEAEAFKSPDALAALPEAHFFDDIAVKERGPAAVGGQAAAALAAEPGRFWVHVDLDVLSTAAMSAVDYWQPGGFSWEELRDLLRPLMDSPAVAGLDVTIYNPTLDPRRKYAPLIVDLLRDVLT